MAVTPKIELHIEELVLHGFPPADCYRIGHEAQLELERLLATQGGAAALAGSMTIPCLDGGSFTLGSDSRPDRAGVEIARSINRSLNNAGPGNHGSRGR